MAKRTTVKAVALGYRDVGTSGDYTPLMGVLKGLAVAQDEPDSTEIEAEFYDSPFDIFYDGNPVTMTFELANYDLEELEDLFGGAYDDTNDEYEAASNAFTSEHEWKLDFGRGNASLVIYKGLTIGTLKKDADGALNYSVTITALIYNDGENDHMYKIVGSSGDTPTPTPTPAVSVWANSSCTQRPIAGQSYSSLYVKFGRAFGINDDKVWGDYRMPQLSIITPTTEYPDEIFSVSFYTDFTSGDSEDGYSAGQIVEVSASKAALIGADYVFDFYDE